MGQTWPGPRRASVPDRTDLRPATAPGAIRFSTDDDDLAHQFEAYRTWMASIVDLQPIDAAAARGGFHASQTIWSFGALRLLRETCDPVEGRTVAARGRPSAVDHWVLALHEVGDITVRSGDAVRQTAPGGVCLAALIHASHLRQDRSEALYLFIPRDQVSQAVAARLDRLHNRNLLGPCARLLADHLLSLERNLGDTPASARADVAAATLELIRACLPGAEPGDRAGSAREQALRERARRHIRCNVAAPIDPGALCGLLGISRSQLYRLFRAEGGVAAIIRAERLAAAREALADPVDGRRIFQVAESFGFGSAEEFSRAFRHEFGCRPSDVYRRGIVDAGDDEEVGLGGLL